MTHNITITNDGTETYYKFYLNSITIFRTNATLGSQDVPPGSSPSVGVLSVIVNVLNAARYIARRPHITVQTVMS